MKHPFMAQCIATIVIPTMVCAIAHAATPAVAAKPAAAAPSVPPTPAGGAAGGNQCLGELQVAGTTMTLQYRDDKILQQIIPSKYRKLSCKPKVDKKNNTLTVPVQNCLPLNSTPKNKSMKIALEVTVPKTAPAAFSSCQTVTAIIEAESVAVVKKGDGWTTKDKETGNRYTGYYDGNTLKKIDRAKSIAMAMGTATTDVSRLVVDTNNKIKIVHFTVVPAIKNDDTMTTIKKTTATQTGKQKWCDTRFRRHEKTVCVDLSGGNLNASMNKKVSSAPLRNSIPQNMGLRVYVKHDAGTKVAIKWGGERGASPLATVAPEPIEAGPSAHAAEGDDDTRDKPAGYAITSISFPPRQPGKADLSIDLKTQPQKSGKDDGQDTSAMEKVKSTAQTLAEKNVADKTQQVNALKKKREAIEKKIEAGENTVPPDTTQIIDSQKQLVSVVVKSNEAADALDEAEKTLAELKKNVLKIPAANDFGETENPTLTLELDVERRSWGAIRFGFATNFFDAASKSYGVRTYSGSGQSEVVLESDPAIAMEAVIGFAPYMFDLLFGRSRGIGRSHTGGKNMYVAPYFGFGIIGQGGNDSVEAFGSVHVGLEVEFAKNFSVGVTAVWRRVTLLARGVYEGSPVDAGASFTREATGFGMGLVFNVSPDFLRFSLPAASPSQSDTQAGTEDQKEK